MKQETLKIAIKLNEELELTFRILEALKDESTSRSVMFFTNRGRTCISVTDRVYQKIKEAIEELNVELKDEIEKL